MQLVYDEQKYDMNKGIPSEIVANMKPNWDLYVYEPILHLSDFWHLKKDMVPLNQSVFERKLNLTLNFNHLNAYWF